MLLDGDKGEVTPQVKDLLQKIMISGNDVITLLAQYLDKSKIELGQLEYSPAIFDAGATVNEILAIFAVHAEQKKIKITKSIAKTRKHMINVDQARFKEVIINIIDNAVKYTPEGSITVTVKSEEGKVVVKVSDTGVGIDKKVIPSLFKEFSRSDLQKVNILGTGIGLYLAKKFTEAQKGSIWAESEGAGKGSQFYVAFPEVKVTKRNKETV
jgi:signal transduction histidine kinase